MVSNMDNFKQNFEDSFSGVETLGFSAPIKFVDPEIGVAIRKFFNDEIASLIKVGILHLSENNIEPVHISITHGIKDGNNIIIRDPIKRTDPMDLSSLEDTVRSLCLIDHYYYDKIHNIFLKNDKEITTNSLIQEVFEKHIKTTRPIQGLFVRIQLWFWHIILPKLLYKLIYNFLHYFLFLISGDRYTYNIFEGNGKINKKSKTSNITKPIDNSSNEQLELKEEESKKMDIFGYKLSQHAAVIYSLLNLGLFFCFYSHSEQIPKVIESMSSNTLIVLFYVIVTLHLFDKWLPSILKFCIDSTVKKAYYFLAKPIRV